VAARGVLIHEARFGRTTGPGEGDGVSRVAVLKATLAAASSAEVPSVGGSKSADSRARGAVKEALGVFTHDPRFLRERGGDGVALGLANAIVSGEVSDVLVVLDDLGGEIVAVVVVVLSSEHVLLGAPLRGRDGSTRE